MNNQSEDFKPVDTTEKFSVKEYDILKKNKQFFSYDKKYVNIMLKIINGESEISIRVLDWFVANYSKKNNIYYKIRINGKCDLFYVHNEYKNQLNGYSKLYFDPFCRKRKIIYCYKSKNGEKDINFISSIGQLNFFQWAIRNKVINYVQNHMKEIETDMKITNKINRKKKLELLNEDNIIDFINESPNNNTEPDPVICSSDKINSFFISPIKKSTNSKSDSEKKHRRQQLSKSVYDHGIKKSNIPIRLDFD